MFRSRVKRTSPSVRDYHQRSPQVKSHKNGFFKRLLQKSMVAGITVATIIIGIHVVFLYVLPALFPLTYKQTIVFVSSGSEPSSQPIVVADFYSSKRSIYAVKIPGTVQVPVIGGYGNYPIASVHNLLKIEKKDATFIRGAISVALHKKVDHIVTLEQSEKIDSVQDLEQALFISPVFSLREFSQWRQQMGSWAFVRTLEPQHFSLEEGADLAAVTKLTRHQTTDTQYQGRVAIVNGAATNDLASFLGAVLEQSGYQVLRITDIPQPQAATQIFYSTTNTENRQIIKDEAGLLTHVVPMSVTIEENKEVAERYRADIVLIVGTEMGELLKPVVSAKVTQ